MRKVFIFSVLLVLGLAGSQLLDRSADAATSARALDAGIRLLTMVALSFIMIQVGYEFEIDKSKPRQYLWDYLVAGTAATFPWIFCAAYFVFVLAPPELWFHADLWKESLLTGRFASPTSAGVLFSMLAAAGLAATWVFRKARILAIFDDLDTILLMIPLKIMLVGMKWQLALIVVLILLMLWAGWRYMNVLRLPITWPWVMGYAAAVTLFSEFIYQASKLVDAGVPIHIEVLLPAFVLGCMLAHPARQNAHADDAQEGAQPGPETPSEQRATTIVSACFMVLVGLSMPPIQPGKPASDGGDIALLPAASASAAGNPSLTYEGAAPEVLAEKERFPGWGTIALHVLAITLISNLGKLFPAFCYRREADWPQRMAVAICMFPRGEVGAGVLVISIAYGIGGPALTVAALSLALNLLLTGAFILLVKRLIALSPTVSGPAAPHASAPAERAAREEAQ